MYTQFGKVKWLMLLVAVLASSFVAAFAFGQSGQAVADRYTPVSKEPTKASSIPSSNNLSTRQAMLASVQNRSARLTYQALGGVDNLKVQETASGALLRFSYRVVDANRARALNDKKSTPYLIDEKTGAVLQVPQMPKVGLLRQTADPVNGTEYWIAFSNKGVVKPGNRVDVVIGNIRFSGLVVQ